MHAYFNLKLDCTKSNFRRRTSLFHLFVCCISKYPVKTLACQSFNHNYPNEKTNKQTNSSNSRRPHNYLALLQSVDLIYIISKTRGDKMRRLDFQNRFKLSSSRFLSESNYRTFNADSSLLKCTCNRPIRNRRQ